MRPVILDITFDEMAWHFDTGTHFRGLTISIAPEGWNIILRATTRAGEPVYAMTQDDDIQGGLRGLMEALTMGGGEKLWRHDRYAK